MPLLITGTPDVNTLPATHDTTTGHGDERAAITAGSHQTAAERYKVRLVAATARLELPDLFELHPDKPDRGALQRWLATSTTTP